MGHTGTPVLHPRTVPAAGSARIVYLCTPVRREVPQHVLFVSSVLRIRELRQAFLHIREHPVRVVMHCSPPLPLPAPLPPSFAERSWTNQYEGNDARSTSNIHRAPLLQPEVP